MTEPNEPRPFTALPKPEAGDESEPRGRERRGFLEMPAGAFGFFLLLVLAALLGSLIALYAPWFAGVDSASQGERLSALETRVGQLAAGQAPKAAAAVFSDLRRDLNSLSTRLDADEARLTAVEKGADHAGDSDSASLKSALDQDMAALNALAARVAKLEQTSTLAAQLGSRLDADERTIADLRSGVESGNKTINDSLGGLGARVATLEHNAPPADLAERLNSFALKTDADAIAARVAKLESNDPVGMIHRAAAVLALAELVRATAGASSFASELSTLQAFVPDAPELKDLSRYAKSGAPTHAMLAEEFPAVAANALAAERNARATGWPSRLWASIASTISVRRIGEVEGDNTEAHLARAGGRLDAGDLPGALREMRALDSPARIAASGWIARAAMRLAVDTDTRALADRLVKDLPPKPLPGQAG